MAEYIVSEETLREIESSYGCTIIPTQRIVRCLDCKHYKEDWYERGTMECRMWNYGDESSLHPEPDGFCAWGEPKEAAE